MKGLILKDFYMIKKYLRFYVAMILIFQAAYALGADNEFLVTYSSVLSGVLVSSLLAYDESFSFMQFCDTLPVTRKTFVLAKYALALIITGGMFILNIISLTANSLINGTFIPGDIAVYLSTLLFVTVIGYSLTLPLTFRFGQEKSRIAYLMVLAILGGLFVGIFRSGLPAIPDNPWVISLIIIAFTASLFMVSMFLSVIFFRKREL